MRVFFQRLSFLLLLVFAIGPNLIAQTLIINEVSNGPTGNKEYVELVVIDTTIVYDCNATTPPCIDIRGWIFDDNSASHGAGGVASGAIRFANHPLWACVPVGTIILIYNNGDPNTSVPPNDLSTTDGNCVIIAPVASIYFDRNATTPGAAACSYPAAGWINGGDWTMTALANSGDCARIVDLSGCEVFSLCYGATNSNTLIYFNSGGSGAQNVWWFNSGNPYTTGSWSEGCASIATCGSDEQTPGAPNNAANAAYIAQFKYKCFPIPPLTTNLSNSSNAVCGCAGSATVAVSGSIAPYTIIWTNSSFSPIGQTGLLATNLCAGTYHAIINSSINCADTITVTIAASSAINPQLNFSPVSCAGSANGQASVNPIGGTGPYTILWSPAPGSGQGTTTATGLTPGNYSVQITDNTGCTQSASFTITQPSALNAVLSPVNPTCNGACDGSITSAVSGGTGSINLIWSNGTNGANINGLCAGNYSVTLTDQNNCTATFSSQLTDPAAIDVIISHTDAGCGGVPGTATAIANGGTGAFSYIWFDSQFNVYPSTPTISNLLPDDYTVVVSDANGCSVAGMVTVTQGFPPSLSETHTDLLCNGNLSGTIDLSISGIAPFQIAWTGPLGFTSSQEDIGNLSAGVYTAIVNDASGCNAILSITLTEPNALVVSLNNPGTVCSSSSTTITTNVSGGTSPYSYNWGGSHTSSSLTFQTVSDTLVCVAVSDANNCPVVNECRSVSVFPSLVYNGPADVTLCEGSSTNLSLSVSGGTGAPYGITWSDGSSIISTTNALSVNPTGTISYFISVQDACAANAVFDTVEVQVIAVPVPAIAAINTSGCAPLTVQFSESNAVAGLNCVWTFGTAGSNDDCGATSFTFTQAGCYDISYSLITPSGCTSSVTAQQLVCVFPDPVASFTPSSQQVSSYNNVVTMNNSSFGASDYLWTFNGLPIGTDLNPQITFPSEEAAVFEVCLNATSNLGCVDSTCRFIESIPDLAVYVPNAFTPNHDPINNSFSPVISGYPNEYLFRIFNRWGELIFESKTPGESWDGNYLGVPCQVDTYVWYLMVYVENPGKEYRYRGHVTLFR